MSKSEISLLRKSVLSRVEGYICRDRRTVYGNAEDNFQTIADFWTTWLSARGLLKEQAQIDRLDVAKMMSLMKSARSATSIHHQDSWDDAVGYEAIGASIVQTENQNNHDASPTPQPIVQTPDLHPEDSADYPVHSD